MKKLFTALSGIALIMALGSAYAAEEAKGIVKEINKSKGWIVMNNGTKFTLAEGVPTHELRPGHDVLVTYEIKGNDKVITGVAKPDFLNLAE